NIDRLPSGNSAAADAFLRAGDSVLLRVRHHVEADGFHLDEQLDRTTGAFLSGTPFTHISWAEGMSEDGRPIESAAARARVLPPCPQPRLRPACRPFKMPASPRPGPWVA
ncbi:MAG: hypothetical protein ACO2YP_12820, partial [Pseudomonadales bacterium]